MRELADFTERLGSDIVIHAIDIARDHIKGRANWSYIRGILRSYMKEGIKTLADAFQREQEFDEATDRHGGKNQQPQRKSFAELADELDKREGRS